MILFTDFLGWDVESLQRPFSQRMQKSQPPGRASQSRKQETGEIPSAWRAVGAASLEVPNRKIKQSVATRTLFPSKKRQHNTLASRIYQKWTKPPSIQFPHMQQVPVLHVLFLFIPRERNGSGKPKKPKFKTLPMYKAELFPGDCQHTSIIACHSNPTAQPQPLLVAALDPRGSFPIPDIPWSTKPKSPHSNFQEIYGTSRFSTVRDAANLNYLTHICLIRDGSWKLR